VPHLLRDWAHPWPGGSEGWSGTDLGPRNTCTPHSEAASAAPSMHPRAARVDGQEMAAHSAAERTASVWTDVNAQAEKRCALPHLRRDWTRPSYSLTAASPRGHAVSSTLPQYGRYYTAVVPCCCGPRRHTALLGELRLWTRERQCGATPGLRIATTSL
jgi:hypothetical protein